MDWRLQTPLNQMRMKIRPQEKDQTLDLDYHTFESEFESTDQVPQLRGTHTKVDISL